LPFFYDAIFPKKKREGRTGRTTDFWLLGCTHEFVQIPKDGVRGRKEQDAREKCIMRSFIICTLHPILMGADKSLAFPISYIPTCSKTKRSSLGWVKEVRTTKSLVCVELRGNM
jgi:hypothetical protein